MCCSFIRKKENINRIYAPIAKTADVLRQFIPCGKVAVFVDAEIDFLKIGELKQSLKDFKSYIAVLKKGENVSGLFSLPDDVRAVIAVGESTFHVARYFCALRNAYCICLPEYADAKNLFDNNVTLNIANAYALYPADMPDAVICDLDFIKDYGAAYCMLALCGAIFIDFQINSVFAGGAEVSDYGLLYNLAANLDFKDKKGILDLYFRFLTTDGNTKLRAPSYVFYKLLYEKFNVDRAQAAYFTYCYLSARYKRFFESAKPRTFFVPDYANRIRYAAKLSQIDERVLFLKNKVPTVKRLDALYDTFCDTRKTFSLKCESVIAYFEKIKKTVFALGVKVPEIQSDVALKLFSASCELSDILSVPTLMRDFGLLHPVE